MRAGRFGLSDAGDLNAILDSKHADTWMVPSNYPGLQKIYCVISLASMAIWNSRVICREVEASIEWRPPHAPRLPAKPASLSGPFSFI